MTALSEATATRRSLIESIRITLNGYEEDSGPLMQVSTEDLDALASQIADDLIDGSWVTEEPK